MDLTPQEEKEFNDYSKWFNSRVSKIVDLEEMVYCIDDKLYTAKEAWNIFKSEQGNKEVINPEEQQQSK